MPRRVSTLAPILLLLVACATARSTPSRPEEGIFGVPGEALGTQTIYRVRIEQNGEGGSVRLVLRLWRNDRFELAASDAFGGSLWRLVVFGDDALWIEGGGATTCRLEPRRPLHWPRLALVLPPNELPALLLGRLPGSAGAGGSPEAGSAGEVVDASGRRWTVTLDGEALARWSYGEGDGRLEWSRAPGGGLLEVGGGEIRIEWRSGAREPVAGTAPALPAGAETAPECELERLP